MAIGRITRLPEGAGAAQYDAVSAKLGIKENPPDGLIFHSAGELEGVFQIFNVWESGEHAERFTRDRLQPARIEVMGEERAGAAEASVVDIPIHNYVIP
jgi:hypothetical protein